MTTALPTLAANPACNPSCHVCHYKDLEYPAQLARKEAWAAKCLAPWSSLLRPIAPAPVDERIAYRAKSWMRSHVEDSRLAFGMFHAVQRDGKWAKAFLDWRGCPMPEPAIQVTLDRLRPTLERVAPRFCAESLFGVWFGLPHLVFVAKSPCPDELREVDWSAVLEAPMTEVWFHRTNQVGRTVFGEGPIERLSGSSAGEGSVHPIRAFRQVAKTLVREARGEAVSALLAHRPKMVLDLFCGTGDLASLLPAETGWLGIEISKAGVEFANRSRGERSGFHRAYLGLAEDRLRDERVRSEIEDYAVYLNPPRPGMNPEMREALRDLFRAKGKPKSIAYLSCSASSLARDLRFFEEVGFGVKSLRSYDFFPQTEHFETLAVLYMNEV